MGDFEVSEIMVVLNHQIKMVFELDVFVTQKIFSVQTKHNLVQTTVHQPKVGNGAAWLKLWLV